MAKKALGRLVWTPSVSTDVVSQKLVVKVNGMEVVNESVGAAVKEYPLMLAERDVMEATLSAFDGTLHSKNVQLVVNIPDLTQPDPPTDLNFVIDEIVEVDE